MSKQIEAGQQLLHYRIVEKIGEGGMGFVWKAEDTKLHRHVALKTLPPEVAADPDRRARFERESHAIAALNHPNIVTIHSIEDDAGVGFISMELVEGRTLRNLVPADGLPLDAFLDVAIPLAAALAAAHGKGITHRDIKPDNVMITDEGHLKVLDFGLAKVTTVGAGDSSSQATRTAVTEEGKILGTVSYMSPEQAEGKTVDPRSDVFSLGIVLYQMVTGTTPFQGDTPISTITSIMRDDPQPVGSLKPALPKELGGIVARCLNKEPGERYPTAAELHHDLVQMKVGGASRSLMKSNGTHRRWIAAAVFALLVIVSTVALFMWQGSGETPAANDAVEASIAVLPLTSVGNDEASLAFSSGIHNDLLIRLSKIGSLKVISRTSMREYRDTTKNLRQIAEELGVATILEGSVQRAGDRVRLSVQLVNASNEESIWAESYDRELSAGSIFDIQADVAGQIASALSARLTPDEQRRLEARPTENLEAYEAYLSGLDFSERSELQTDILIAAKMMERAVELDPKFAEAHAHLGRLYSNMYWNHQDRSPERLAAAREAIETAERLSPGLPEASMARGFYHYWGFLDYEQALEEFAMAAKGLPNDTTIIAGVGFVMRRQGRMKEALAQFRKAVELNPRDRVAAVNVPTTLMHVREYDEAERKTRLQLRQDPKNVHLHGYLAQMILLSRGDVERACETLAKADELGLRDREVDRIAFSTALAGCDPDAARRRLDALGTGLAVDDQFSYWPRQMLEAWWHRLAGDEAAARTSLDAARLLLEAAAIERPQDERIPSALGRVHAALGRKEDAIREGLRGVEMLPYEKEAMRGAQRMVDLAMIYAWVDEPDQAVDRLEFLLQSPVTLSVPMLRVDPAWDPIRDHPRFQALVKE